MKYSEDQKVWFEDSSHTYFSEKGKLKSVTTFIHDCSNKFDSDYHSKRIAEKEGVSQEEILKRWKDKADYSCEMGTYLHKMQEDFHDGLITEPTDKYPKSFIMQKLLQDIYYTERLTPVKSEYIVCNNYLAGQIDRIDQNKKGELFINDFKTNEKITIENYGKYMLGLLKQFRIPDSNFHHYSLQLSIYKILLDWDIKGMYIIHIDKEDYKFIKALDYTKELKTLDIFK